MRPLQIVCSVARAEEKALLQKAADHGFDAEIVLVGKEQFPNGPPEGGSDHQMPVTMIRTPSYFAAAQIASVAAADGRTVVNTTETIGLFGQKIQSDAWLAKHGFGAIPSRVAYSQEAAIAAAAVLGFPLVVKPSIGGFGRMVQTVRDVDELRSVTEIIFSFAPASHQAIYLQKFVDIAHDVRAILIGHSVLTAFARELPEAAGDRPGPRNVAQGAVGRKFALAEQDLALLERLAQTADAAFLGVDLLIAKDGVRFICDINPVCRFDEAARVTEVDIAGHFLAYAATA